MEQTRLMFMSLEPLSRALDYLKEHGENIMA